MSTIVVGFIFGTKAHAALDHAVTEACLRNTRLVVVHSAKGGLEESDEEVRAYSEALEGIDDELAAAGVDHEVEQFVLGHEPAEDIVRIAREKNAEMIVIGVHRRSKLGKLVLGSAAQDILLQADCPVLAVKPTFKSI